MSNKTVIPYEKGTLTQIGSGYLLELNVFDPTATNILLENFELITFDDVALCIIRGSEIEKREFYNFSIPRLNNYYKQAPFEVIKDEHEWDLDNLFPGTQVKTIEIITTRWYGFGQNNIEVNKFAHGWLFKKERINFTLKTSNLSIIERK